MADPYIALDIQKASLNISEEDDSRDALLSSALGTASRSIDRMTGRTFTLSSDVTARTYRTSRRISVSEEGQLLIIDDIGSVTGLEVRAGPTDQYSTVTNFEPYPENALALGRPITGLLRIGGCWTAGRDIRVEVTARWGWPAVPEEIRQATLIQASRLYKRKDSPEGVLGSAEWGTVRVSRIDPDVWALVRPYALPGFG
jgi:hypothetical protein